MMRHLFVVLLIVLRPPVPGAWATRDLAIICHQPTAARRHVSEALKTLVLRRDGLRRCTGRGTGTWACPLADSTVAVPSPTEVSVVGGERVAPETNAQPRVRHNSASHNVDPVANEFQVGRIAAGTIPTEMVKLKALRDRASVELERDTVRQPSSRPAFGSLRVNNPVALPVPRGKPWPTSGPAGPPNFRPQSLFKAAVSTLEHYRNLPCHCRPWELDHLIPLELGGANSLSNLWAEPWPDARTKDVEENLHREVCAGRLPIAEAQADIARWGR